MTDDAAANWRKALITENASVEEAVRCLNAVALQIALVVDGQERLVGTITDGDIRRGLLAGLTLQSPLESIVYRNPLVVPPGMRRDLIADLMRANRIHQLPVVDESRRVVGLHLWDEMPGVQQSLENVMVIMAGGFGTRLKPHTLSCPKPLLPVAGKPILEHIIERAKGSGFSRFVVSVHYLGHMIEEHFGDGSRLGVGIRYLREDTPLGTAGALQLIEPRPHRPFVVTNGDVLTDIHYGELLDFHIRGRAGATMAVRMFEWQHPFGVVHTSGISITGFEEKPVYRSHVNAGVYVLEPQALDLLPRGEPCDMPVLFEALRQDGKHTIVYPMHEPWLDVGRPTDYDRASSAVPGALPQSSPTGART